MAEWLCLASTYEISSKKGLTQKEFLKYLFVHLDAILEDSEEVHSVMAGSSTALVRFDHVDLVPHPFLYQGVVVVTSLVSDGPWLSPAHTETLGMLDLMLQRLKVRLISTSLKASIFFEINLRDRVNFSAPSHNLPAVMKKDLFRVCSVTGGRYNHPSHVCAHRFNHIHWCTFCFSWLGLHHPGQLIHSRQSICNSNLWSSKGAVEEAIFGEWSRTDKRWGHKCSRGQRPTQAF